MMAMDTDTADTQVDAKAERLRLAAEVRREWSHDGFMTLVNEYAVLYRGQIPALDMLDRLLADEGALDVVTALEVLEEVIICSPAYRVVLMLHHANCLHLPDDDAVAKAIEAERTKLRKARPNLKLAMEGQPPPPGWGNVMANAAELVHADMTAKMLLALDELTPATVREVWMQCQMLGFEPFEDTEGRA